MSSKRTFYKTTIEFEVLSDVLPGDPEELSSVYHLAKACVDGDFVCAKLATSVEEIVGPDMADELTACSSHPNRFRLNERGGDLDA